MYKKVIATGSIVSSLVFLSVPATFAQTATPPQIEQRGAVRHTKHLKLIAEKLGLSVEDIKKELESGKTIPQVLEEHGISKETLHTQLGGREGKMSHKLSRALDVIAPKLGLNAEEVRTQIKAGKTFKEVLEAHGITQEQVKANFGEFKHEMRPELLNVHAEILGITVEDLQKALDSGKTMDQIIAAHGLTMAQFKEKAHASMKSKFPDMKPQMHMFKQFNKRLAQ